MQDSDGAQKQAEAEVQPGGLGSPVDTVPRLRLDPWHVQINAKVRLDRSHQTLLILAPKLLACRGSLMCAATGCCS
jgi:hypothetical protein